MKFFEPLSENVKVACASLLGTDEISLTEIQYYHHLRENPRMQSASLFILNETLYGTSVGRYDIDVAKRLMSAMLTDSPILSEGYQVKRLSPNELVGVPVPKYRTLSPISWGLGNTKTTIYWVKNAVSGKWSNSKLPESLNHE